MSFLYLANILVTKFSCDSSTFKLFIYFLASYRFAACNAVNQTIGSFLLNAIFSDSAAFPYRNSLIDFSLFVQFHIK